MLQPNTPPTNPFGPHPGRNPYQQPQRPSARRGCLACLPWLVLPILLLVLLFGGTWLLVQSLQSNASFVSFYTSNHDTLLVIFYIGVFATLGFFFLSVVLHRTVLRKPLEGVAGALLLLVIAGAPLFFVRPQIDLTRTGFSTPSLTIATHGTVTFDNPSDGVTQTLCVGRDQHCAPDRNNELYYAPSQLVQGLVLHPGQSVSITFDYRGNYHITSKTTPQMNLIISVNASHPCQATSAPHCWEQPEFGTDSQNSSLAQKN